MYTCNKREHDADTESPDYIDELQMLQLIMHCPCTKAHVDGTVRPVVILFGKEDEVLSV